MKELGKCENCEHLFYTSAGVRFMDGIGYGTIRIPNCELHGKLEVSSWDEWENETCKDQMKIHEEE
jgi:hypothetical protein